MSEPNQVDPNFAPEGYIAIPMNYYNFGLGCSGCAFDNDTPCLRDGDRLCEHHTRPDGRNVIFIKKEKNQ